MLHFPSAHVSYETEIDYQNTSNSFNWMKLWNLLYFPQTLPLKERTTTTVGKTKWGKSFRAVICLCESATCPTPFHFIYYSLSLFLSFTCPSFPHPLFLLHRKKTHLNKEGRPWPLKYRAENLPRLMGVIDLFDTLWIYEAASQVRETNKAQLWANKQVAIQPDTSQRLRRACLSLLLLPCWGKALSSTQTVSWTHRAAVTLAGFHSTCYSWRDKKCSGELFLQGNTHIFWNCMLYFDL